MNLKKILKLLLGPKIPQKIWGKFLSLFSFEQWTLLVREKEKNSPPSWHHFKKLIPPKNCFWADPFPLFYNGNQYIFYEVFPFSTERGHISCITLDKQNNILNNQIVLQRPYHLSYPFIFTYKNELYMLPETHENKTIEIYRCKSFPDQWEFDRILINNITAVDATLFEHQGKWWMFVNIIENGGNSHDTLNLYYAESPLSTNWTPHPKNPIQKGLAFARPAGRIITRDNVIIRPSQDCSTRYGYAINFNKITALSETEYEEVIIEKFCPPTNSLTILSTHTWNESGDLEVIDAEFRRIK